MESRCGEKLLYPVIENVRKGVQILLLYLEREGSDFKSGEILLFEKRKERSVIKGVKYWC